MLLLISIGKEEKDVKRNSIKAEFYDKQNFIATNKFMDLCYDYTELSLGFQGILKVRYGCYGYKLDVRVAKAAKLITSDCSNYCPCCSSGTQTIEHWLIKYPIFSLYSSSSFRNIKNSIFLCS